MKPAVSVVVPTFNGAVFIEEALRSVWRQTWLPEEVIVVDDASRDETREIVEKVADSAPLPLRLIALEKNSGGPAHPLNVGIAAASGEFIAILDQDDVFLPDKLKEQAAFLWRHPEVSMVFSLHGTFQEPQTTRVPPFLQQPLADRGLDPGGHHVFEGHQILRWLMQYGQFMGGYPGFVFRKKDWEDKKGLDETLPIGSDFDTVCWLSSRGKVGYMPRSLYLRRKHEDNLCNREEAVLIDEGRVKMRYAVRERWLLQDRELSKDLKSQCAGLVYWQRKTGDFRDTFACYRNYHALWGHDWTLWMNLAKTCLFFAWRKLLFEIL